MRRTKRECVLKEDASERNCDRFNLLADMTEWYKGLVQQEAGLARLKLSNLPARPPRLGPSWGPPSVVSVSRESSTFVRDRSKHASNHRRAALLGPHARKKNRESSPHMMLKEVAERELPVHLQRSDALRQELLWSHTFDHCSG